MKTRTRQVVDAGVIAFWRERYELLDRRIAENPTAENAWFWRVQWDILNYLLHRYGGTEKKTLSVTSSGPPPLPMESTIDARLPETQLSASYAPYAGLGKMPRASGAIRPLLRNIVEGNQDRHADLQRQRELAVQAKEKERQERIEFWEKNRYRFPEIIVDIVHPAETELSDDEIVDMLAEIIRMDNPPEAGEAHKPAE